MSDFVSGFFKVKHYGMITSALLRVFNIFVLGHLKYLIKNIIPY